MWALLCSAYTWSSGGVLADHKLGWGSILDGRQGFWVSQAPRVRSCHPFVCCCWPPLLPSRSEVFCFPLNSIRSLALSAQSRSVFFAYRQSELIGARQGGLGVPVGREMVAQAGAGQAVSGWSSIEPRWPLRLSTAFPGTGLHTVPQAALGLLWLRASPAHPVHSNCPELCPPPGN